MKKFMLAIFVLAASTVALAQSQFLRRTVAPRDWFFAAPAVNNVTNISNPAQGSIALDTSLSTPAFYGNVGTPITPNWVNLQGGGSGTLTLRTTSSNPDNCNSADQVVTLTANSATVTKNLCGASAVPNKVITLIHGGISLSNEYLITPSGSDTINGGSPGASYNLYTNGEKVTLVSDGVSNWQIIQHETETGWVDAGVLSVTGSGGTNPGKGSSTEHFYWKRSSQNVFFRYEYVQTGVGSPAGTGAYVYALPTGLGFNTSFVSNNSQSTTNITGSVIGDGIIGNSASLASTQSRHILARPWSSTAFYISATPFVSSSADGYYNKIIGGSATASVETSAAYTNTNVQIFLSGHYPVSGWQP